MQQLNFLYFMKKQNQAMGATHQVFHPGFLSFYCFRINEKMKNEFHEKTPKKKIGGIIVHLIGNYGVFMYSS